MNFVKCTLCSNDSKLIVAKADLLSLIKRRLGIFISKNSDEPTLVCSECCLRITEFDKFRKRARKLVKESYLNEQEESANNDEDIAILTSYSMKVEDVQPTIKAEPISVSPEEDSTDMQGVITMETSPDVANEPLFIKEEAISISSEDSKGAQDEMAWISPVANKQLFVKEETISISSEDSTGAQDIVMAETSPVANVPLFIKNEPVSPCSENSTNIRTVTAVKALPLEQNLQNEASEEEQSFVNIEGEKKLSDEDRLLAVKANKLLLRNIRSHCHLTPEQRICSLCLTVWPSTKLLFEHRRKEHPKNHRKVPGCEKIFNDSAGSRGKKLCTIKCDTCKRKFEKKIDLKLHQCRSKKYRCPNQCGNRFKTEEELATHFKDDCYPGSFSIFTCSVCKKILSSARSFKLHYQKCMNANNVDLKSPTASNEPTVQNSSIRNIDRCTSSPTTTACTTTTSSKHKTNGTFKCMKCDANFDIVDALGTHYHTCKGDYSNAIKCSQCKKSFISLKSLQLHQITESHRCPQIEDSSRDESNFEVDRNSSRTSNDELNSEIKIEIESDSFKEIKIEPREHEEEKTDFALHCKATVEEKYLQNKSTTANWENDFTTQAIQNESATHFENRTVDSSRVPVLTNQARSCQKRSSTPEHSRNMNSKTEIYRRNNFFYRTFLKPRKYYWRNNTRFTWLPKNKFRF